MGDEWNDWARNAEGKINKKREDERLANQKYVAEEEMRKRDTPQLWEETRSTIKSMVDALNARIDGVLNWSSIKSDEVIVTTNDRKLHAEIRYNAGNMSLHVMNRDYFANIAGGKVTWNGMSSHDMAKTFMDSIITELSS